MFSGILRHFSVVSLLLVAGAGLILLEGPVGPSYLHQFLAPNLIEKESPKSLEPEKQASVKKVNVPSPSWASTIDEAAPLHATVLGVIPVNGKSDTASK